MSGELPVAARSLLWPTILLALAGWIVALAGLASLQRQCNAAGGPARFGVGNQLPFSLACGEVYRFHWWILFFELPLLLGIAGTTLMGRIYHLRTSWLALLATCTALYMYSTNVFLNLVSTYRAVNNGNTRASVTFSGFLIVAFANCLLMFLLGMERVYADPYKGNEYGTGAGIGTGAAVGTGAAPGRRGMFSRGRNAGAATGPVGTTGTGPVGTTGTGPVGTTGTGPVGTTGPVATGPPVGHDPIAATV